MFVIAASLRTPPLANTGEQAAAGDPHQPPCIYYSHSSGAVLPPAFGDGNPPPPGLRCPFPDSPTSIAARTCS